MIDHVLEQVGWPVDTSGRLVIKATSSASNTKVGCLPPGFVPVDADGSAVVNITPETPKATFNAPLKTSLSPAYSAVQGTMVSLARATVATTTDYVGMVRYVRAGEARFIGARRTSNLIADSEGFTTGWTLGASTTLTPNSTGGGLLSYSGSSSINLITLNSSPYEQGRHTFSIYLWGASSSSLKMRIERSSDSYTVAEKIVDATSGARKRFSIQGVIVDGTNHRITISNVTSGAFSFNAACSQLENTDGTDGSPGDYLARGISGAAPPYLGAGVEGVMYSPFTNTWSVDLNGIATKTISPTPIESEVSGLLREYSATQRLLYNSTLNNAAWSYSTTTPLQSTTTDNPIGYGRFYTVTDKISQSWSGTVPTAANNLMLAASAYVKIGTAKWANLSITRLDGSTIARVWFNIETGAVGTLQNVLSSDVVIKATGINNIYRIGFSTLGGASGSTAPLFSIAAVSGDGSTTDSGLTLLIGGTQLEANDHVTSYIGNTAGSVIIRNADVVSIPTTIFPSSRNDLTIGFKYYPLFNPSSTSKRDFYYISSCKYNGLNRFGITHRPGSIGGGADDRADDIAQDYYFGAGTEFGGVAVTGTTTLPAGMEYEKPSTVFFGISSTPQQPNGDGSFCNVNGVEGISTTGSTPTLAQIAMLSNTVEMGSDGQGTGAGGYMSCVFSSVTIFDGVVSVAARKPENLVPPSF